jgi:glutathionylspermidine synthase
MDDADDAATTAYMADVATQAGIKTRLIDIADVGLNGRRLVDLDDTPITHLFKLYPWEWLTSEDEDFAAALLETEIGVMEPPWRVAAASKGLLVDLWEANPGHPNLLHTSWREADITGDRVGKPILGREGANVALRFGTTRHEAPGSFGDQARVWQARAPMPVFHGGAPVFGVWVVAGEPIGLGIREDTAAVTGPTARFIPHRIV